MWLNIMFFICCGGHPIMDRRTCSLDEMYGTHSALQRVQYQRKICTYWTLDELPKQLTCVLQMTMKPTYPDHLLCPSDHQEESILRSPTSFRSPRANTPRSPMSFSHHLGHTCPDHLCLSDHLGQTYTDLVSPFSGHLGQT